MVSIRPPISNSSRPDTKYLGTIPSALVIISINITLVFHSFLVLRWGSSTYPIYQPLRSGKIWHKVNFEAEFNRFELRIFLLLD